MAVGSTPLDPYGALSVPHDASPATIRSSYKKLMLQCHPDKVRDEAQRAEKAQQYQKVQEAYELLIDSRRRRKYDEELARNPHGGTAAASAAAPSPSAPADETKREKHRDTHERRRRRPQEETTFNEADREAAGGTARQTRYKAEEIRRHDQQREREREREQREREREREQREREQREREREREHHRREEVPKHSRERRTHGSTSGRYAEQSPLKPSSYEQPSHVPHVPHVQHPHAQHVPRTPHAPHNPHTPHASHTPHTPHAPQASHPPPGSRAAPLPSQAEPEPATAIRPGYAETIAAEEAKLEAVRRRTREAQGLPTGSPRTQRSNSHDSDANGKAQAHAAMADHTRLAQQQQAEEQQRRERERRERKARKQADHAQDFLAERMGRSTDIPIPRSRKFSVSPSGGSRRRGSSSVCKDDFLGATPPHSAKPPLFSGSVPTTAPFYGSPPHVGGPGYPHLRRRHSVSSPSLEKQTSRSHRQSQPPPPPQQQDSGYSSPSSPNDASTPITFEKKSNLNPGGSSVHPQQATPNNTAWKRYIVYVQEDGTTSTAPPQGIHRKTSSAGSPESSHAEPAILSDDQTDPITPDFIVKAGIAGAGNTFVVHKAGYTSVPAGYAASASGSHSSHSSPRVPTQRHHSVHHSPRMGGGFETVGGSTMPSSPGLSRASTYSTPSTRRPTMPDIYPGFVAPTRGGSW